MLTNSSSCSKGLLPIPAWHVQLDIALSNGVPRWRACLFLQ
jgi:D-ribose pyranose/furanose isomerase RbsD